MRPVASYSAVNPAQVAWFLLQLCRLCPDDELEQIAFGALEGSLERGWDPVHGGLLYMIDVLGKPLADCTVTAEHKLWWPMAEALYGCMLALELTGDRKWLDWLQKVHTCIYKRFCDAQGGGEWFGYLRPDGSVFNECKGRRLRSNPDRIARGPNNPRPRRPPQWATRASRPHHR